MNPKRTSGGRLLLVAVFGTAAITLGQPTRLSPDPLLKDVRIALRFGADRVLILGGEAPSSWDLAVSGAEELKPAQGYAALQPGQPFIVPPDKVARYLGSGVSFRIGQRWTLYTGAGPPVKIVIQSLAQIDFGGGEAAMATAIAGFESPGVANQVAGLRAAEYLAVPAPGLVNVSSAPLIPTVQGHSAEPNLDDILLREADLNVEGLVRSEFRYTRWNLPGGSPLLFIEALWRNDHDVPLFAASAVAKDAKPPSLISFDPKKTEQMRFPECAQSDIIFWILGQTPTFLNAWKIGNRYFVLTYRGYCLGFEVSLKEIVPGVGLVPVGLEFGAGDA